MAGADRISSIGTMRPWLTDGGFGMGRGQAGFEATDDADIARHFHGFMALAQAHGTGFMLDTATAGAGQVIGAGPGQDADRIALMNARAAALARRLCNDWPALAVVVNGVVGPAGGRYRPDQEISAWHATMAHSAQVEALARAGVDLVTATAMTHVAEAIGIAGAATAAGLPCVVSFAIGPDGRLLSGQPLDEAIYDVEQLDTPPLWYGVECPHPGSFAALFDPAQDWTQRIGSLRVAAWQGAGAEGEADDPQRFGKAVAALAGRLANLRVIGGCHGTGTRHLDAAARACLHDTAARARA